ncbi:MULTISPECIES: chemotaxis protein CheD [Bacillaceae]|uniref:Probable chemoreceptor glutamine deamidase CheD n=1 Tax=Evansella alkalicola TaxID=745819 RepID=A0ABS6JP59_9BACI|nr:MULTISPECIES: chemotaxis protein CheD [Bacillaceae]MBU9720343.1 chemotaxis protein CheD [Bacillus alkalicola]
MSNVIQVGMADLKYANSPNKIRTSGLGSCVGLIIYDEREKKCGMAHIMLPESSLARNGVLHRPKYADTAIEDLVKRFVDEGSPVYRLKAKIAGGAQMFNFSSTNEVMRIGPRNAEAVKVLLEEYKIKLISEDVGGNSGRTIEFNPDNSILQIKTINKGIKEI